MQVAELQSFNYSLCKTIVVISFYQPTEEDLRKIVVLNKLVYQQPFIISEATALQFHQVPVSHACDEHDFIQKLINSLL